MEINSSESTDWLLDYALLDEISLLSTVDFPPPDLSTLGFWWTSDPHPVSFSTNLSVEVDCSFGSSEGFKEGGSQKRSKSDSSSSGSRACRNKLRRDTLNERFQELCSILEPGRPHKTDKAAILSDAVGRLTQLRIEAKKLKESNNDLLEKIKELKAEKSELRDEKLKLKAEKEKLEQQVKLLVARPCFMPHPSGMGRTFAPQGRTPGNNKSMPFVSYPGGAMWKFMSPAVVDTSKDHVLRPPVA